MINVNTIEVSQEWKNALQACLVTRGKRKGQFKLRAPSGYMEKAAWLLVANNAAMIRARTFLPLREYPDAGYGIGAMIMHGIGNIDDYPAVDKIILKAMINEN